MEFVKNLLYMSLEFTKNVAVLFSRHRPKEEGINHLLLVSLYWGVGGGAISYNGEKCGPQYVGIHILFVDVWINNILALFYFSYGTLPLKFTSFGIRPPKFVGLIPNTR